MLYVFYGTDREVSRERMREELARIQKEDKNAPYERLEKESWNVDIARARAEDKPLFSSSATIVIDGILDDAATRDDLASLLPIFAESENNFLIIAGPLIKDVEKEVVKHATKSVVSKKEKEAWKSGGATFSCVDAVAAGDKKNAWTHLILAREEGTSDEELIGALFWRFKTMLLAKVSVNADEAGLKPFVFGTAKRLGTKYTKEDIKKVLDRIVEMLYQTRRSSGDVSVALESFVLGKNRH